MKKKKILALALALWLAIPIAGCGKDEEAQGNSDKMTIEWLGVPYFASSEEGTYPETVIEEKFNVDIKPIFMDEEAYNTIFFVFIDFTYSLIRTISVGLFFRTARVGRKIVITAKAIQSMQLSAKYSGVWVCNQFSWNFGRIQKQPAIPIRDARTPNTAPSYTNIR